MALINQEVIVSAMMATPQPVTLRDIVQYVLEYLRIEFTQEYLKQIKDALQRTIQDGNIFKIGDSYYLH